MITYPGMVPSNVGRDAKYSVVWGAEGQMEVRLIYRISAGERVLLTTDRHEALVEIVNDIKVGANGAPGGVFYINEYRDVLVPTTEGCFFAGDYQADLEFNFEGTTLGPRAPAALEPGEPWPGPHAGVRYGLTADGSDVKYAKVDGNRELTEYLSNQTSSTSARDLAQRLGGIKGLGGGRIYINEATEFFTPIARGGHVVYTYLGSLREDDPWFPAPDVPRSVD